MYNSKVESLIKANSVPRDFPKMSIEKRTGAVYKKQRKYREKIKKINLINAEFMAFAEEKAPELVAEFFAQNTVRVTLLSFLRKFDLYKSF